MRVQDVKPSTNTECFIAARGVRTVVQIHTVALVVVSVNIYQTSTTKMAAAAPSETLADYQTAWCRH